MCITLEEIIQKYANKHFTKNLSAIYRDAKPEKKLMQLIMLSLKKQVHLLQVIFEVEGLLLPKMKAVQEMSKILSKIDFTYESENLEYFVNTYKINLDEVDQDTLFFASQAIKSMKKRQ